MCCDRKATYNLIYSIPTVHYLLTLQLLRVNLVRHIVVFFVNHVLE